MRRRGLITLTLRAAILSPVMLARAQQSSPVIGILGSSTADDYGPMVAAFRKGLSEAGYLEGKNVGFEYAWADDHYDRLPELARKLVERRVTVILAAATPSALAAKSVTSTIPIVFAIGGDPVRTGLVSSLNSPGGNHRRGTCQRRYRTETIRAAARTVTRRLTRAADKSDQSFNAVRRGRRENGDANVPVDVPVGDSCTAANSITNRPARAILREFSIGRRLLWKVREMPRRL